MEVWNHLIKTALLGTHNTKPAYQAKGALGSLLDNIQQTNHNSEQAFLQCAAVVANYRVAGQSPFTSPISRLDPAKPDTRNHLDSTQHLKQLLNDESLRPLLDEWLYTVNSQDLQVSEVMIPTLLNIALKQKPYRQMIAAVVGARGRWLAQQNPRWQTVLLTTHHETLTAALWEEGNIDERLAFLVSCRKQDPNQARLMLETVWTQEAARERSQLIEALAVNLNIADEAFLCQGLNDKSKEVRQRAVSLLVKLPTADLPNRLQQRLSQWLVFKAHSTIPRKLARKKGSLDIVLPEQWETSWKNEGIHEKAPTGTGQKAWWLEQMLGWVDPDFWCQHWHLSVDEIFALMKKHEWETNLYRGWQNATLHFGNQVWASAFIHGYDTADNALWQMLDPPAREAIITHRLAKTSRGDKLKIVFAQLSHLNHYWSQSFSQQVIVAWAAFLKSSTRINHYHYTMYDMFRQAACHLDSSVLDTLEKNLAPYLDDQSMWHKILNEVVDIVRFRHDMHQTIIHSNEANCDNIQ